MRLILAPGTLLPLASAMLSIRALEDPVLAYLQDMCYPFYRNTNSTNLGISSLANSPSPCEQTVYLEQICRANGTTVNDFLAEQECLCNGSFFTVFAGCDDCWIAHGYQGQTKEESIGNISSLSIAECAPTPPFQPYSKLLPTVNITSQSLSPLVTLRDDRFPNMTAVGNYFTETASATPGSITGSATATSSGSTSSSTGAAATRDMGLVGGILAAGFGVVAML